MTLSNKLPYRTQTWDIFISYRTRAITPCPRVNFRWETQCPKVNNVYHRSVYVTNRNVLNSTAAETAYSDMYTYENPLTIMSTSRIRKIIWEELFPIF
ncbi:hypothetical protein CEXT_181681 [Caerostris extrusa]|uniref:Uncharacterized protein n=1 Tax=Caerostris extrusa TaxID=172846 RepID=A0AAV4PTI9_CAEEX|nr:hypothetical protein CEXT_181681 [Caerostris extrusa]